VGQVGILQWGHSVAGVGDGLLLDRRRECELLDRLIEQVRAGQSRALVVRGEAGVGKTALLEYLLARAPDCRVAQAAGVQAEKELAFAALHQVCAPMLDRLGRLPRPQQDALRTAFGLSAGSPPDRFLVGLAVLCLLAEVARERPLVCVVDDAQWLDRASAQLVAFVARRLMAESVAIVLAVRESPSQGIAAVAELAGLPELSVAGLPEHEARTLLVSAHRGPVDMSVLDRILAETRGNPLALRELPRGFTPTELAGGFGLWSGDRLPHWIEESFRRQVAPLPADTQQLLLVAAAEPLGDPVLLWRAAWQLGINVDIAAPQTKAAGLIEIGARVQFRHPLVRSAIYRNASPEERRNAHWGLAQVTDPDIDPDRRAWHRAQAADGPDDEVAAELERSAGRAQARGGLIAAAAFLERATELTPDPARRGGRALAATQAKLQAGMPNASLRLLSLADASPLDELQRGRADLLRAEIAFTTNRGSDAPALLLKAAGQLEQLDVQLARDTYLDGVTAAWFAAHLASGCGLREVAEAARAAPAPAQPRPADLLLGGLAVRFTDGYSAGAPILKRALQKFRDRAVSGEEKLGLLWFTNINVAADLWDDEALEVITDQFLQVARRVGALSLLPLALTARIAWHIFAGELDAAGALLEEQEAVVEATGIPAASYGTMLLAAWQARDVSEAIKVIEAAFAENALRGEGAAVIATGWVKGLLYNSLGRYDEARAAVQQATDVPVEVGMPTWSSLVELVIAAARAKRPDQAAEAFDRLRQMTRASGSDWALGLEARCRALLCDGSRADDAYREAIDRLARTRIRGELARAHLFYGEWLRRDGRRRDARDQLRTAHQTFTAMGADVFAGRAARELAATGESVRKRSVETVTELTAQEGQIVRLVRQGLSNGEVAARLFIRPRTVEWHLSKIFGKLQITSRRQLQC
jgi:DNA-binding CsgD family transcriptional regulator/tetratricopeptide (TPR) repeat protein